MHPLPQGMDVSLICDGISTWRWPRCCAQQLAYHCTVPTPTMSLQGMDVSLICDGSGAGRGGGEKKDVLPPLMPGMKPRQQA